MELNQSKTLITHARSQRARFLGYDICVQHTDTKITGSRRMVNGKVALLVSPDVIKAQCARYRLHGKPWHRSRLQNLDDYDIVRIYGAEYRSVVQYYLLARDVCRLSTLHWHAFTSMLKTLDAKQRSTVTKMANRHKAKVITPDGPRTCFEGSSKLTGSCRRLVTRRVFLVVALRERRRVPRVHAMRTRLRWLAGLRNPYARRASSLASRVRLSETEFVIAVRTAAMISFSHRYTVLARDSSSGMSSFCAHQS